MLHFIRGMLAPCRCLGQSGPNVALFLLLAFATCFCTHSQAQELDPFGDLGNLDASDEVRAEYEKQRKQRVLKEMQFRADMEEVEAPVAYWHRFKSPVREAFSDEKVALLVATAINNDLAGIDKLVKEGVDVNTVGKNGATPLLYAIWSGSFDGYARLLHHKANPNHCWGLGESAVHYAFQYRNSAWLTITLRSGGDPNVTGDYDPNLADEIGFNTNNRCGLAPILTGPPLEPGRPYRRTNFSMLIAAGANLEAKDRDGRTALEHAFRRKDDETALVLLEAGASIDAELKKFVIETMQDRLVQQRERRAGGVTLYYFEKLSDALKVRGVVAKPE